MALPTVADLKSYCRVEHAAEDGLLAQLVARARADVEQCVRRPLEAVARTFAEVCALWDVGARRHVLHLPLYPVDPETVAVTDADGVAVDPSTYRVDGEAGRIVAKGDARFDAGPYAVTAMIGLSTAPDYATAIEPVLAQAIIDWGAELYENRNPSAQAQGAGGGVYTQRSAVTIPARIAQALAPLRLQRGVG